MRSIDLVAVGGSKASQKVVLPLVTGKNVVGSDSKCNCQVSLKLMQPKHFDLLISKNGEITLVPQVEGLQLQMPNGKMKELEAFNCYSLDLKKHFYVERTIAFSFEVHVDKKGQAENGKTKGSLWKPRKSEEEVEPKKKQKKQQETEEEEVEEEVEEKEEEEVSKKKTKTQKAKESKGKQSNSTKTSEKPAKNKKKQVIEQIPVEESEEEEEEIEEEKPKQKPTKTNKPAIKSSKNKQTKEKKSEGTTKSSTERVSRKKDGLKVILSNCEITPKQKETMEKLGVTFTRDINDNFSVVIMEEFKRRVKLLVGLNKGAMILSKNWVLDCIDDKELITNFEEYFIEISEEDSKKFDGFNLDEIQLSTDSRKPNSLFSGYSFILPEDPQETAHNEDLTAIIESGNGKITTQKNTAGKSKNLLQLIDKDSFKKMKSKVKGLTYADPEFVLLSSLKQEIQDQLIFH